MLEWVELSNFGVFHGQRFELAPVTVFRGDNQSGKSTLFDAIRLHAFRPRRTGAEARALYARYGEATEAALGWAAGPPDMSLQVFMNLFALGPGHVQPDLSGDWVGHLKRNLFAGGIDPQALVTHFDRAAATDRRLEHMRHADALEKQLHEVESALADKEAQRARLLADFATLEARQAEVGRLEAVLREARAEADELAARTAEQEAIARRRRLEERLAELAERERLSAGLARAGALATDERPALADLEQARLTAREHRAAARAAADRDREEREAAAIGLRALAERRRRAEPARLALEPLRLRLEAFRQRQGERAPWLRLGRAAAWALPGLLLALGAAAAAWLDPRAWAGAALGLALAAGGAALGWRRAERVAAAAAEAELRIARDRWRAVAGAPSPDDAPLRAPGEATTLAGFAEALEGVRAHLAHLDALVADGERRLEERAAQARAAEEAARTAAEAVTAAEGALTAWLQARGCATPEAYREALADHARARTRLAELDASLAALMEREAFSDPDAVVAETQRLLGELDARGVPRQGVPPEELERLKAADRTAAGRVEALEREHAALDRHQHGDAERLKGLLGGLPLEIAALGEERRKLGAALAEVAFERDAAARARDLFGEVAADETAVLAELSQAIAGAFGALAELPAAEAAAVELSALRNGALRARDRQGTLRDAAHLSTGAQQLLFLALRLELARRERGERFALLCLDEPFAYLDEARTRAALAYLRGFLAETGWQLLLFTCDRAQARLTCAAFPGSRLHELAG